MTYDIVTIGDAVSDLFIRPNEAVTHTDRLHDTRLCFLHGAKISVDEMHRDIGGSACNVAVGLARLGFKAAMIGAIGADSDADKIEGKLSEENVDIKYLKKYNKFCTNFSVIIVYKGDRTVFVYRGLKDYSIIKIPKNISAKWLYLGPVANSFKSNYKDIISLVSEKNINLAINPGHRQIIEGRDELKRLIYISKLLILNKEEALDLTKLASFVSIKDLLKRLKSYGPEMVVVTDGEKGAYLVHDEDYVGIKPYKTEVVDNTGAGDAFSSGFIASLMTNNDLTVALKSGIMNASEVITEYGAQTKLSNSEKLKKIIGISPDIYNL